MLIITVFVIGMLIYGSVLGQTLDTHVIPTIAIKGNHFINTKTNGLFFIKGLDYQPGGSSTFNRHDDPLSNPQRCARDIAIFQELGINTIRVYSINPELNHDICMTMLATANIYLVLDVNSPLVNQHLNRYEPWTTYNPNYLEHVFQIVKQFSEYPNTLAFFAGNEIVNDKKSAKVSPRYIKQLISDIKQYSRQNCKRIVPVGYSAADDLDYRISLAEYLSCEDKTETDLQPADFYGVNSYQWCGEQTMESSGYNILLDDYKEFDIPLILSEFGCNKVKPRIFTEISEGIFTPKMMEVFSGGLAYEYSMESNGYGIVNIGGDDDGDVQLLPDFWTLKKQYELVDLDNIKVRNQVKNRRECRTIYDNINIKQNTPAKLSESLIKSDVNITAGRYIPLNETLITPMQNILGRNGEILNLRITEINDLFNHKGTKDPSKKGKPHSNNSNTLSSHSKIMLFLVVIGFCILS